MNADGWVTIGTKLDSKQLERDLKNAEKKLQQFENQVEKLTEQKAKIETTIEINETEYKQKIDALNQKYKAEIQANTKWGQVQDQPKIDAKYDQLRYQLEIAYGKSLDQNKAKLDDINKKIQENVHNQGLVNNKIEELNNKLNDTKGFNFVKKSIDGVGNSVEKVTKKIGRMALAVFGIRSAFMFVRNAINTIANDDEQLKADIDYMKSAIAYTLEPIVRGIVDLAKQLMFYVGYIVKAFTGKNIFANANKGLKSATGSAKALNKELSKTTASFDEMNILQDTSSSSASGGTSGIVTPSFDLSAPDNIEPPEWLTWLVDHKNEVLAVLGGIVTAIGLINIGLGLTKAIGIGIAIAGIIYAIEKLIDYLNDPTFNNFIGILEGIAVAVLGIGIAVASLPIAIAGAIALIVLLIVQNFDKIMNLFNGLISWLDKNVLGALKNLFGPLGNILYAPIKYFAEMAKGIFESFYGGIKRVIEGVMKIFQGDFWGGIKSIFGGMLSVLTAPLQGFLKAVKSIIPLVINFFQEMWGYLKQIGSKAGEVISGAFKGVVNGVLGAIENILNFPIRSINKLIGVINKVPGINLGKLSTFNLPRLAKGGIVNNPGPGVMMGSYIAGEKGPEAVIPLDDATLDRLGLAFARHTTINATIPVYAYNRQVAREIRKIEAEQSFATNS